MQDWLTQGTHRYQVEADLVRWWLQGPVTIDDLKLMFDLWVRMAKEHGQIFTLLDVRAGVSITTEARHYMGERSRTAPLNGVTAIVGASFMLRTLIMLVHNALRLLGRTLPPVHFCSLLEEAEAWLHKTRQQLHPAAAPPA